ncbi:hypothetical protein ACQ4PT_045663 [Festuca glaucescens]
MTQYTAPVTAREVLGDDKSHQGRPVFLCSSDELRFDAPPRALADKEELQSGWLYFVLPVSMHRLALYGHEMAALAVRASSALAVASGVASPPRRKTGASNMQRKTSRVAPLVLVEEDALLVDGGSSQQTYGAAHKMVHGSGEKVGKARKGAGYRSLRTRRAADVQRLSSILEADEF